MNKFPWKWFWAFLAFICFVGLAIAWRDSAHWEWLLPTGLAALTLAIVMNWGWPWPSRHP